MDLDYERVVAALPAYEVGEELGRGSWGIVLAARHKQLHREVAVKQLPPQLGADAQVRARFIAEARLLASLDHPHIVPIYDFVEHDGLCLFVLERLTGGTVMERWNARAMSPETACALTLATCAGLHYAHQRGVLHRDVKPENLMFSGNNVLKVTDFGIAKVLGGSATVVTRVGNILGTPAYMAPEQAQAKQLGPATDVYATATVLYELLSGELPFEEDNNPLAMLHRHISEEPRPLAEAAPNVPRPLAQAVDRAVARDPGARYGSAEGFGMAIARAATDAWGPGWLDRSGVVVNASGPILTILGRTPAEPDGSPDPRHTVRLPPSVTRSQPTAAPTPPPRPPPVRSPSSRDTARPGPAPQPAQPAQPAPPVRPAPPAPPVRPAQPGSPRDTARPAPAASQPASPPPPQPAPPRSGPGAFPPPLPPSTVVESGKSGGPGRVVALVVAVLIIVVVLAVLLLS